MTEPMFLVPEAQTTDLAPLPAVTRELVPVPAATERRPAWLVRAGQIAAEVEFWAFALAAGLVVSAGVFVGALWLLAVGMPAAAVYLGGALAHLALALPFISAWVLIAVGAYLLTRFVFRGSRAAAITAAVLAPISITVMVIAFGAHAISRQFR